MRVDVTCVLYGVLCLGRAIRWVRVVGWGDVGCGWW